MSNYKGLYYPVRKRTKSNRRVNEASKNNDSDDESEEPPGMPPGMPDILKRLQDNKKSVFREHNHIYFRCDVTVQKVNKLCNLIDEYNREQQGLQSEFTTVYMFPKPIYLHILSFGGDLLAGYMAYDYIKNSKVPIYTVAEAYAVSAGSIMYMAGKRRFMHEHSYLLIHQLSQGNYGNDTFQDQMDNIANSIEFMSKLYKIYLENTRYNYNPVPKKNLLTKTELENHMIHDLYWNYDTCYKYGLVDELYTNYNDADNRDIQNFLNDTVIHPQPPRKIYTANDFKPSDQIISKISENFKQKTSMMDLVQTYLENKKNDIDDGKSDDIGGNDEASHEASVIKKSRQKRKHSK